MKQNKQSSPFLLRAQPINKINQKRKPFNQINSSLNQSQQVDTYLKNSVRYSIDSHCFNHPQKQSKFQVSGKQGKTNSFCSKCAIILASNQYQVKKKEQKKQIQMINKLEKKQIESYLSTRAELKIKKNQIDQYLQRLQKIEPIIQGKVKELSKLKNQTKKHYVQQKQYIDNYYTCLISLINAAHQNTTQQIRQAQLRSLQLINHQYNVYQEFKQKIGVIKKDINQSINSILKNIDYKQYREIMTVYQQIYEQITYHKENAQIKNLFLLSYVENIERKAEQFSDYLQNKFMLKIKNSKKLSIKQDKSLEKTVSHVSHDQTKL